MVKRGWLPNDDVRCDEFLMASIFLFLFFSFFRVHICSEREAGREGDRQTDG